MAVYSVLLANGPVTTAGTLLYTVPVGIVAVVRDLELLNTSSGTLDFSMYIQVAGGAASTIWRLNAIPANTWNQWHGRVVIPTAGELFANVGAGQAAQITATGYQLSLP